MFWHCIWNSFWHIDLYILTFYLPFFLAFYLASILTYFLAYMLTFFLASMLAFYLASFQAFDLASILAFYLPFCFYLAFSLAFPSGMSSGPGALHGIVGPAEMAEEGEQGEWAGSCTFVTSLETLTRQVGKKRWWFPVDLFFMKNFLAHWKMVLRQPGQPGPFPQAVVESKTDPWWSFACRKGLTLQDLPLMEPELMLHGWTIKVGI